METAAGRKERLPGDGTQCGNEVAEGDRQACSDLEMKYLTVYAFSTENWETSGR